MAIGTTGEAVKVVQRALRQTGIRVGVDGAFGNQTRNALVSFQTAKGLTRSGQADLATVSALGLVDSTKSNILVVPLRAGAKGDAVRRVQGALVNQSLRVAVDGDFGLQTRFAVYQFQKKKALRASGDVDLATAGALGIVAATAPATATTTASALTSGSGSGSGSGSSGSVGLVGDLAARADRHARRRRPCRAAGAAPFRVHGHDRRRLRPGHPGRGHPLPEGQGLVPHRRRVQPDSRGPRPDLTRPPPAAPLRRRTDATKATEARPAAWRHKGVEVRAGTACRHKGVKRGSAATGTDAGVSSDWSVS